MTTTARASTLVILLALTTEAVAWQIDLNKITGLVTKPKEAFQEVDQEHEIEIGGGLAATLLGAAPLVADERVQGYVNRLGFWLALHTERSDLPWRFGVLDTGDVNAFAAPGGYIFVTRGLLRKLNNEAELAGVLAHEIAHVLQKHHLRAIQKTAKAGILADVLGIVADQTEHRRALNRVINTGVEIYARGLDKEDEFEADRMGVIIAARAGYDAYGLPAVLQTLEALNPEDSSLALMFKTHPAPTSRLGALELAMGTALDPYSEHSSVQAERFEQLMARLNGSPGAGEFADEK